MVCQHNNAHGSSHRIASHNTQYTETQWCLISLRKQHSSRLLAAGTKLFTSALGPAAWGLRAAAAASALRVRDSHENDLYNDRYMIKDDHLEWAPTV